VLIMVRNVAERTEVPHTARTSAAHARGHDKPTKKKKTEKTQNPPPQL